MADPSSAMEVYAVPIPAAFAPCSAIEKADPQTTPAANGIDKTKNAKRLKLEGQLKPRSLQNESALAGCVIAPPVVPGQTNLVKR
jgi:hypothetical protein